MKNVLKISLVALATFAITQSYAQTDHPTTGEKVKATANKVGHKTSEIAVNGESAVVDKKYAGKYGPYGESVYIDKNSRYYYVTKKGHKVYTTRAKLRNSK